jgi:hypothetical protein
MNGAQNLSAERLALAEDRLRYPRPGSRIAAARQHGVDLTLLIENLRLTPAERVNRMHDVIAAAEQVRGAVRRRAK